MSIRRSSGKRKSRGFRDDLKKARTNVVNTTKMQLEMEKNSMIGKAKIRAKELEDDQRKKVLKAYDSQLDKISMSARKRGIFWNKYGKRLNRAEAEQIPQTEVNQITTPDGKKMNRGMLYALIGGISLATIGVIAYLIGDDPDRLADTLDNIAGEDVAEYDPIRKQLTINNSDAEIDMSIFLGIQDIVTAPQSIVEDLGGGWEANYVLNNSTQLYETTVTNSSYPNIKIF